MKVFGCHVNLMPLKGEREKAGLGREKFHAWGNFAIIPDKLVGMIGADCPLEETYIGQKWPGPCSIIGLGLPGESTASA